MDKNTHIFLPLIFLKDSVNSIHLLHTEGEKAILKLQLLDGAEQECGGGSLLGGRKNKHNWGSVEQLNNKKSVRTRNQTLNLSVHNASSSDKIGKYEL